MAARILRISAVVVAINLLGALGFLAFREPADPLERIVRASDAADFSNWCARAEEKLPQPLVHELAQAFTVLNYGTPRDRPVFGQQRAESAFCRRVNGKTIRTVLIDAYYENSRFLLGRINAESMLLEKNLRQLGDLEDADRRARFERVITQQKAALEQLQKKLEQSDRRTKELQLVQS